MNSEDRIPDLSSINIVFVWSQYDGGNIDKEQLAKVLCKTLEAKLKIVGRRLHLDPTIKYLDPTIHYITSVIMQ